jgi:hypothetical protein
LSRSTAGYRSPGCSPESGLPVFSATRTSELKADFGHAPCHVSKVPNADIRHVLVVACSPVQRLAGLPALSRGSHVKKSGEEIPQILPCFKTDAGYLRRGRDTLGNDCVVAIAAEGLETEGVDLGAAEPEGGYDMQAE